MFRRMMIFGMCTLLLGGVSGQLSARTSDAPLPLQLHLQRVSFDPLRSTPATASGAPELGDSALKLIQLSTPPNRQTQAVLIAAGLRPLLYIPDNGWLVRSLNTDSSLSAALPNLRWSGPFRNAYKLAVELEEIIARPSSTQTALHVLVASDRDPAALEGFLRANNARVLGRSNGPNGTSLQIQAPGTVLYGLLIRDDVLWIEPLLRPQIQNDRAQRIVGVTAARQQLPWLNGAGQIIAVTDTGLDVQSNLSADFAGRLVRGFSNKEMNDLCNGVDWSDHHGHGTHVAGTALGSGALAPTGLSFAGAAPNARLVVQSVSSGGPNLDCLPFDASYLGSAYAEGARIQNASWGGPSGSTGEDRYGRYTLQDQEVDTFLWQHRDHLFVVAASNQATDSDGDGVVDEDSITMPAIAKNVLAVGASENDRPPATSTCSPVFDHPPEQTCWGEYGFNGNPFGSDFVSNNPDGLAAFSGRGPADDGRIKPELVAPGTNIISARSHDPAAFYYDPYNDNYAYDSGTSMATPLVSGMAALVRQWLAQEHFMTAPSAALVKAILLNGATTISPGQYGTGLHREIPAAWPNNMAGWGRASLTDTIGLGSDTRLWLKDVGSGLETDQSATYTLTIAAGQPLRVTLAWIDYPSAPAAGKALVNDLDLEIQQPDGVVFYGNAGASLPVSCRSNTGADRCNNVESIEIATPIAGTYVIRVRGQSVPYGPQPFALAVHASQVSDPGVPGGVAIQAIDNNEQPKLTLTWSAAAQATFYQIQTMVRPSTAGTTPFIQTITIAENSLTLVEDTGSYSFRVRGCNTSGCGPYSNSVTTNVTISPFQAFLTLIGQR